MVLLCVTDSLTVCQVNVHVSSCICWLLSTRYPHLLVYTDLKSHTRTCIVCVHALAQSVVEEEKKGNPDPIHYTPKQYEHKHACIDTCTI